MSAPTLTKGPTAQPGTLNSFGAAKLVAGREIKVRLRDKSFIFSSVFMLLIVAAATILPALFGGGATSVAAVGPQAGQAAAAAGAQVKMVDSVQAAEDMLRAGEVDAAVVPDASAASPLGVAIIAMDEAPSDLIAGLSVSSPVELLAPTGVDPALAFLVPFAFAMVFFMTTLTFGLSIAQSVVEEKQTRVVELLVSSIPIRALLAGKVLGNTVLAMGQIILLAGVALIGLQISGGSDLFTPEVMTKIGTALAWFIPFFLAGFLLLAGLWAVAGALVSRQEDLGSSTMPIQILVMLPFFGVIYSGGSGTLLTVLSYLPFGAPVAMPVRMFTGNTAFWEPMVSLVLVVLTAIACILLASRLYQGSLLRTNGRTSIKQAWSTRS